MTSKDSLTDRVTISADAWRLIDALLAELPYRISAPIVQKLIETGGVQPLKEKQDAG
ncbi:MAG: hypothetical protein N2690_05130 [Rhodocyclaceae bacterium]|nr:hypothetical protein [Rhodocyclaceae bacterium]